MLRSILAILTLFGFHTGCRSKGGGESPDANPDLPMLSLFPADLSSYTDGTPVRVMVSGFYQGVDNKLIATLPSRIRLVSPKHETQTIDIATSNLVDGPNPFVFFELTPHLALGEGWYELQVDVSGLPIRLDNETPVTMDKAFARFSPMSAPVLKSVTLCWNAEDAWTMIVSTSGPVKAPDGPDGSMFGARADGEPCDLHASSPGVLSNRFTFLCDVATVRQRIELMLSSDVIGESGEPLKLLVESQTGHISFELESDLNLGECERFAPDVATDLDRGEVR